MAPRGRGPAQASPVLHQLQGGMGGGDVHRASPEQSTASHSLPLKAPISNPGLLAKAFGLFSFRGLVDLKELSNR